MNQISTFKQWASRTASNIGFFAGIMLAVLADMLRWLWDEHRELFIVAACVAVIISTAVLTPDAHAQATRYERPGSYSRPFELKPQYVPSTLTDVATEDVRLDTVTLTNESSSTATCTIQDRQGTPLKYVAPTRNMQAGEINILPPVKRWMPGGVSWTCSPANAVVGYLAGSY